MSACAKALKSKDEKLEVFLLAKEGRSDYVLELRDFPGLESVGRISYAQSLPW